MTTQKSFKRLVRSRMEKTGESYTSARASLLGADEAVAGPQPALTVSEAVIRRRTGKGWEEWFGLLDEWGATHQSHGAIAGWVREEHGADGWSAQAVTVSYERARSGREIGERRDGFAISVSKTVAVPVNELYDACVVERERWLPDADLRERTISRPRSARFDWSDGSTRVNLYFEPKGEAKSTVFVEHARLADAEEAERMKAFWRERVKTLAPRLEGGRDRCLTSMSSPSSLRRLSSSFSAGAYYAVLGAQLAQVSQAAAAGERPEPWKLAVEFIRGLILAAVVAGLASQGDIDDWSEGLALGLALWIGFPFVLWTGAMLHENTSFKLAAIHAGDWLLKLLVLGVIVSVWP